ncbi:MAG: phenylalanine--tRNA ligase subunit beta [Patescibacteria group bacterium]
MKIPYGIIRSWTKFKGSPEELKSLIDLHITEVEEVVESGTYANMVVGDILEILPHPNADRLQITKTKVGEEVFQIVCGGKNIKVGQKVPVALPGSTTANGIEIQASTIRGEDSLGMLCSDAELGFPQKVDGVMILDSDLTPGTPLSQVFDSNSGLAYDLKVLANRPDYMSFLSIAREVSASMGEKFSYQLPTTYKKSRTTDTTKLLKVKQTVKPDLCARYLAKVVTNVTVVPSPQWLQDTLQAAGIRPINNLVDAANLVMLETGQPIHIFDLNKINRHSVTVRMGKGGESIKCLDEETRKLSGDDIVIADSKGALAIAGIIGGEESAVTSATTDIAIELANFDRKTIRLSSRRLGVRTDASSRFERGVDVYAIDLALERLLNLIEDLSPKAVIAKGEYDLHKTLPPKRKEITFDLTRIQRLIDLSLSNTEITKLLELIDLPSKITKDKIKVSVPNYRSDIQEAADIAEEIIRIHGLDKIEARFPMMTMAPTTVPALFDLANKVANIMSRMRLVEVKTHPFIAKDADANAIALENPLNENWSHLKTRLLPTLINFEYQDAKLGVFEINKVFAKQGKGQPMELTQVAARFEAPNAYSAARGALTKLFSELGINDDYRELPSGLGLEVVVNGETVGEIIYHTPTTAGFEINLDQLVPLINWSKPVTELAKYPVVKFDLAFEINSGIRIGKMQDAITEVSDLVVDVELFDIYEMADLRRSTAFHISLRSPERTLTKEDRDTVQKAIIDLVASKFQAKYRG